MKEDKLPPIGVAALRAEDYSADGREIIVSVTTKYSASQRRYSVPIGCFDDFIVDLQRLHSYRKLMSTEVSIQPATDPPLHYERADTDKA